MEIMYRRNCVWEKVRALFFLESLDLCAYRTFSLWLIVDWREQFVSRLDPCFRKPNSISLDGHYGDWRQQFSSASSMATNVNVDINMRRTDCNRNNGFKGRRETKQPVIHYKETTVDSERHQFPQNDIRNETLITLLSIIDAYRWEEFNSVSESVFLDTVVT